MPRKSGSSGSSGKASSQKTSGASHGATGSKAASTSRATSQGTGGQKGSSKASNAKSNTQAAQTHTSSKESSRTTHSKAVADSQPARIPRENGPKNLKVPNSKWSKPIPIVSPSKTESCTEKRNSGPGYRAPAQQIKEAVGDKKSGVYEIVKSKPGKPDKPVYLGKTKDLAQRMGQYGSTGSHKKDEFAEALSQDFELKVKIASCENPDSAEREALQKYDYAWNKQQNKTP